MVVQFLLDVVDLGSQTFLSSAIAAPIVTVLITFISLETKIVFYFRKLFEICHVQLRPAQANSQQIRDMALLWLQVEHSGTHWVSLIILIPFRFFVEAHEY